MAGSLYHVDADRLGWWLCERQLKSGGLNGMTLYVHLAMTASLIFSLSLGFHKGPWSRQRNVAYLLREFVC